MEIKILKSEKDMIKVEINNLTIAEILRVYLNKDSSVTFAAWKQKHSTENPILKVETKGKNPKKAINDAVKAIEKDLDKTLKDFKGMK